MDKIEENEKCNYLPANGCEWLLVAIRKKRRFLHPEFFYADPLKPHPGILHDIEKQRNLEKIRHTE